MAKALVSGATSARQLTALGQHALHGSSSYASLEPTEQRYARPSSPARHVEEASRLPINIMDTLKALTSGQHRIEERLRDVHEQNQKIKELVKQGNRRGSGHDGAPDSPGAMGWSGGVPVPPTPTGPSPALSEEHGDASTPKRGGRLPLGNSMLDRLDSSAAVVRKPSSGDEGYLSDTSDDKVSSPVSKRLTTTLGSTQFLPEGWPQVIQMRDQDHSKVWDQGPAFAAIDEEVGRSEVDASFNPSSYMQVLRHFVVDPNKSFCMTYDCLSLLLLMYDLTMIPVVLAWSLPTEGFISKLMWVTLIFWTLDIVFSFFRGYHQAGYLQTDIGKVAHHYLRTAFVQDVIVVGADWLSMVVSVAVAEETFDGGGVKMFRFAKIGRMLRLMRVLRVLKYTRILDDLVERHIAMKYHIIMRMSSVIAAMAWMNHLLACAWFAIGVHGVTDTGSRWPDTIDGLHDHGFAYEYSTSFHWAIAQLVLGAIEIKSVSSEERFFTVFCLMLGLIVGSTLISSLSASMVEFQMSRNDRSYKLRTLRNFLRDHSVHVTIAYRVQKQVLEGMGQEVRVTDKEVRALEYVSSALRTTLRVEVYQQHLITHPLFKLWSVIDYAIMRVVCANGVDFRFLRQHDSLFSPGAMPEVAHTVTKGVLCYMQSARLLGPNATPQVRLTKGKWVLEMALWTHWQTVGICTADSSSELVSIRAEAVMQLQFIPGLVREIMFEYRVLFHNRVVESGPPYTEMPTDVSVPFTEFHDMVYSMDCETKADIGRCVLQHEGAKTSWWRSGNDGFTALGESLNQGKCLVLLPSPEGGIEKIQMSVAVRIEEDDGKMLVQVGRFEQPDKLHSWCQLPSIKQEMDECPQDALKRLFSTRLEGIRGSVVWAGTARHPVTRSEDAQIRSYHTVTTFTYHKQADFAAWAFEVCMDKDRPVRTSSKNNKSKSSFDIREAYIIPARDIESSSVGRKYIYMWVWPEEVEEMQSDTGNVATECIIRDAPLANYLAYEANEMRLLRADDVASDASGPEQIDEV